MSKRRHNFGTKRFKEKSLFIFHARIALKSLILLFVRLIARGARIGKTHTDRHTDRTSTVTLAHAHRGLISTYAHTHIHIHTHTQTHKKAKQSVPLPLSGHAIRHGRNAGALSGPMSQCNATSWSRARNSQVD